MLPRAITIRAERMSTPERDRVENEIRPYLRVDANVLFGLHECADRASGVSTPPGTGPKPSSGPKSRPRRAGEIGGQMPLITPRRYEFPALKRPVDV